jgi:hypothetical protein
MPPASALANVIMDLILQYLALSRAGNLPQAAGVFCLK